MRPRVNRMWESSSFSCLQPQFWVPITGITTVEAPWSGFDARRRAGHRIAAQRSRSYKILDAVGSPSVQVYYDVANMTKQGYDIYKEIRQLGSKRICEIHCKENGFLLGQGRVDFKKFKEALDEIGYEGWLIFESARGKGKSIEESYIHNQKYLRSVFSA